MDAHPRKTGAQTAKALGQPKSKLWGFIDNCILIMPVPALPQSIKGKSGEELNASTDLHAKEAVNIAQGLEENVFLFVPNLIGYTRIVLAAVALYYMPRNPWVCTVLYGCSCLLDAFDGYAARLLGQSSRFGAVLDMITDRCTTAGLLCYLSAAYPTYALLFQGLLSLDFSSHYVHMYSTLLTGSKSHKAVESDVSRILSFYYNTPRVLFFFCAGNELFFFALYLIKWDTRPLGLSLSVIPVPPLFTPLSKLLPGVEQWVAGLTFAQILTMVTFPVCFSKNLVNIVQGWKASKILVGVDLAERGRRKGIA